MKLTHLAAILMILLCSARVWAQCHWQVPFATLPGPDGPVTHLFVWDADGSGPSLENLVVRGSFTVAGDVECPGFAMYDGETFVQLASPAGASSGGPIGVTGDRLVGVFSVNGETQVWYWDTQGLHFDSVVPAGGEIRGVARGQVYGVASQRLSFFAGGVFVPFSDPIPSSVGGVPSWTTDGQDFVSFAPNQTTYLLGAGGQWIVAPNTGEYDTAFPYRGSVVWKWTRSVGTGRIRTDYWGGFESNRTFQPFGGVRSISPGGGLLAIHWPMGSESQPISTLLFYENAVLTREVPNLHRGGAAAVARFRGELVFGGDFYHVPRAIGDGVDFLCFVNAQGVARPAIDVPTGNIRACTRLYTGDLLAEWRARNVTLRLWQQLWSIRRENQWLLTTPTSFDFATNLDLYSPRFYNYGPIARSPVEPWMQLNGTQWIQIPMSGNSAVAHERLLLPQNGSDQAWNEVFSVTLPYLRTGMPRVSIGGILYGNLRSDGSFARLDGEEWTSLGADPTDGGDMYSFEGNPVGVSNDGRVLMYAGGAWQPLGHPIAAPTRFHLMAEWNNALYFAGDPFPAANGMTTLARWNGVNWIGVPAAPARTIISLLPTPEGLLITSDVTTFEGQRGRGLARLVSPCSADLDCSGDVDGDDVIAFFTLWDTSDARADLTRDGSTDGDDIIWFFADLESGGC